MTVSRAEAAEERRSASADLAEDGEPALVRFDRNWRATGRALPAPDWVEAQVHALTKAFQAQALDGRQVVAGDHRLFVAALDLGPIETQVSTLPLGGAPGPTGYEVLLGPPGGGFPEAGGEGVRRLTVLGLLDAVKVGSWPVLYELHVRGG